jgi:hypothetical protein
MKSKFSIRIVLPLLFSALILFVAFGTLIPIIIAPSHIDIHTAGASIILLLILILCYRLAKFRFNKIRIDKDALYISPFLGLWTNRILWSQVSGIERSITQEEDNTFKILYIYINNVKEVKISDYYYANLYKVYRSLSQKTKVFGSEFGVLRRDTELAKPISKLWSVLVITACVVAMLGLCLYICIEQIIFSKNAIRVSGTVVEVGIAHTAVSFLDQQGHEHWCFPRVYPSGLQQGEFVQVLFSSSHPDNARIDSFKERWLLSFIYGMVSTMLCIGLIWSWRIETFGTRLKKRITH